MTRLQLYAGALTLVVPGALVVASQDGSRRRFAEIDVERINVVERDGTIKLVLSNRTESPGGTLRGEEMRPRGVRSPGLYFFNGEGDECGGLTFGGGDLDGDGTFLAYGGLTLDRYQCDQVLGLQYSEHQGRRYASGLRVWDRPLGSLAEIVDVLQRRDAATGAERDAIQAELDRRMVAGEFGRERLFLGSDEGSPALVLRDRAGNVRLHLYVDEDGSATLQFLGPEGELEYTLPPPPSSGR